MSWFQKEKREENFDPKKPLDVFVAPREQEAIKQERYQEEEKRKEKEENKHVRETKEKQDADTFIKGSQALPADDDLVTVSQKDSFTKEIESILEEDLTDLFLQMTPDQQIAFKIKGEETASKIRELLHQTKINVRKILSLLREWLSLIPGVNKFFLEQETKIKTDKLLAAKKE